MTDVIDPNATPGTEDAAAQKAPKRAPHPMTGNEDTSIYPFAEIPADFDPAVHSPLKRKDFAHDYTYFEYRAGVCQAQADKYLKEAEDARTLGSKAERAAAKRLTKMVDQIGELRAKLEAQGVDVDELIANAGA